MRILIESKKINLSDSFRAFVEDLLNGEERSSFNKEDVMEYLSDNEADVFWDCLSELYPEGELVARINCEVAETVFVSKTRENIEEKRDEYNITLSLIGESGEIIESFVISGADILLEFLDNESSCGEFCAKVSGYVEKSLELFVDRSRWHFGSLKKDGSIIELKSGKDYAGNFDDEIPLLWFGPTGEKPEGIWTIKYGEQLADGWFEDDQWSLIEYLLDACNECFGVWYLAECGRWLPDMGEIIESCPIKFEATDTIEIINMKFQQYFQ